MARTPDDPAILHNAMSNAVCGSPPATAAG
jgi:hypothetical protein